MEVKINDKIVVGQAGQTILELARSAGVKIPSLCQHPDLEAKANCRVCVVEIKGNDRLVTACSTPIKEGMEIATNSSRVKNARRINLELLLAEHTEACPTCLRRFNCDLLILGKQYKLKIKQFSERKGKRSTYCFAKAVEIDGSQCIDCQNCLTACARQGINYLTMTGSGVEQEVKPFKDKQKACIYCGQCTNVCPVAAAQEQSSWPQVERDLHNKNKIVVAQFAPAVRVSLGEEFGLPVGTNCEGKIYTALKQLGFHYIFDVNFGADITTMTEAEELLKRLRNKKAILPMITSCCPAWVAYAEFYHPELLPNLTTARSPQLHTAGAIKTYWAKKNKIPASKIVVVSIVPCTAKKYEASRPELWFKGKPLVDYVLTTRELAFLIKKNNLDFKKLIESRGEALFNEGSGAAAIYGASGGVMESALRSVTSFINPQNNPLGKKRLEFKDVRGLQGFKEAIIDLGTRKLRVGVVSGISNFSRVLPKLKKYQYIEVMACPGGCLGGGGQPIPTTQAIRQKRLAGMYNLDQSRSVRRAHENKAMIEYYEWVKCNHLEAQVLHTKFKRSAGSALQVKKSAKNSFFGLF